jgi:tRNA pseudouridine38-40 synthase
MGTDEAARSPFLRRWEWALARPLDRAVLEANAVALLGDRCFRAFAVQRTAGPHDHHRCTVLESRWREREGGLVFEIEGNRFLHHMVRFLVGTMVDAASGRREPDSIATLLRATDNADTSAPAPPHGLFLESVHYPPDLYLTQE